MSENESGGGVWQENFTGLFRKKWNALFLRLVCRVPVALRFSRTED
jgi:hypothetical protein